MEMSIGWDESGNWIAFDVLDWDEMEWDGDGNLGWHGLDGMGVGIGLDWIG